MSARDHAHPWFHVVTAADQGPREWQADATASHCDPESGLWTFAVADGVGDWPWSADVADDAVQTATRTAVHRGAVAALLAAAGPVIDTRAAAPVGQRGDTTLVVVVALPDSVGGGYDIAWVGDSRAWCFDGTELHQLTTDHTKGQEYRQPDRPDWLQDIAVRFDHVLTRSLGRSDHAGSVGTVRTYGPHGRLLLTTDGIHKELPDEAIERAARRYSHPHSCAERLIHAARNHGSRDNAAVLVADPNEHRKESSH